MPPNATAVDRRALADLAAAAGLHDLHVCNATGYDCMGANAGDPDHLAASRGNELIIRMAGIGQAAGDRKLTAPQLRDYRTLREEYDRLAATRGAPSTQDLLVAAGDEMTGKLLGETVEAFVAEGRKPDYSQFDYVHDSSRAHAGSGEIRVLKPEQRMGASVSASDPGYGITMPEFIRGIVTGDWGSISPEERVMAVGTGSAGGFLVPTPLALRVIDKARNAARVIQAGALTVPMDTATLKIARVAGDATAAWKLENAAATPSDMTLETITFTARTLIAIVKASVELVEDAEDIDNTIEDGLASALALEVDRVALRGTGTPPEPRGVLNQTGVTLQSQGANGAAFTNYDPISTAIQTVRANNGEPNAVIYSPRTSGTLDRLKDTTNQPLRPPPTVDDIRTLVTKQLPENLTTGTSNDTSEVYVGQWNELLLGVRRTITIEASRQAADTTNSAFTSLQVWIRAYLRMDVQLAHPEHFVVIQGVR